MSDKKLPKAVITQIKKTCDLLANYDWMYGFEAGHFSIGTSGPCCHVDRDWLHETFKEYKVKKYEELNYEYHYAEEDGVTFYTGCDMVEEGED